MEERRPLFIDDLGSGARSSQFMRRPGDTPHPASEPQAPSAPATTSGSVSEALERRRSLDPQVVLPQSLEPQCSDTDVFLHGDRADSPFTGSSSDRDNSAEKATKEQKYGQHVIRMWWRELLACTLFLSALLALFATLWAYFNRPSPKWPSWLSLNTVIAIYIALLKTGILLVTAEGLGQLKWSWLAETGRPLDDLVKYDNATRGPVGALALLWRLGARGLLASTGALIIVLCIALDPFAQQIIHYDGCPVPAALPARIPRSGYHILEGANKWSMTRAALAGIFSPVEPPHIECGSGNCTWPPYTTIGWCHTCTDLTDQLVVRNVSWTPYSDSPNVLVYNYTTSLPDDGGLSVVMNPFDIDGAARDFAAMGPTPRGALEDVSGTGPAKIDFVLGKNVWGAIDDQFQTTGSYVPVDLLTLDPLQGCNSSEANATWPCRGYGASRCSVYHCVKTFEATMRNGRWQETLLHTFSDWKSYNNVDRIIDSSCLSPDDRGDLALKGFTLTDGVGWQGLTRTNSDAFAEGIDEMFEGLVRKGCLYMVQPDDFADFKDWLRLQFTGSVTAEVSADIIEGSAVRWFRGSDTVQTVFNLGEVTFEHVDRLFANVTESLTNWMRPHTYDVSEDALGTVMEVRTCVSVRWQFLVFPTALALLSLAFFTVMVTSTRPSRGRPQIWKSSPLALLYHGLRPDDEDGHFSTILGSPDLEDIRSMRRLAKVTEVRLDRSTTGTSYLKESPVTSQIAMLDTD